MQSYVKKQFVVNVTKRNPFAYSNYLNRLIFLSLKMIKSIFQMFYPEFIVLFVNGNNVKSHIDI